MSEVRQPLPLCLSLRPRFPRYRLYLICRRCHTNAPESCRVDTNAAHVLGVEKIRRDASRDVNTCMWCTFYVCIIRRGRRRCVIPGVRQKRWFNDRVILQSDALVRRIRKKNPSAQADYLQSHFPKICPRMLRLAKRDFRIL